MITISKPIKEVVRYVMDGSNWTEWNLNLIQDGCGLILIKAETVETNIIEATYLDTCALPPNERVIRWLVSHNISGKVQIVIFSAGSETIEYIFAPREQRASTVVERNEASPLFLEDMSTVLLSALKKSIEKEELSTNYSQL